MLCDIVSVLGALDADVGEAFPETVRALIHLRGRRVAFEQRCWRTHAMELNDRVVLITGAKRIGQVVARELAARGADIAVSYRGSRAEAEQTAADVQQAGRRAAVVAADVAQPADCAGLIEAVVAELGRLDVLINMASIYQETPFDAMTEQDWQRNIDVNLRSVFLCAKAAVPHMRRHGGGRIINFADWLAKSGRPAYTGFVAYYTAKAGVIALTEALALELAADQILVNAIAPGPILAPPGISAEERDEVAAATPVGRWGGEIEIAKAVRMLIESEFVTGETIRVDGGRHVR
jgi:NAD(P)-dependent dehydrogenase (short-subunit alcohol dehydrogenase family)